jgi:Zn-dependent M16 (insulinase) family peptidase
MNQLYPGNSSLTQQTGGRLHNLRESTTIEKVRAYHKKFYRPENMFLTITGNIDPAMLFAALDPVERKIMGKADEYPEFEKPFSVSF